MVGERVELTWNVYMRALHSREGVSVEFRRLIEKVRAVAVTALESGDGGDVVAGDAHGAWAVDLGERMAFGEDEAAGFSEDGVLKVRAMHLDEVLGPMRFGRFATARVVHFSMSAHADSQIEAGSSQAV